MSEELQWELGKAQRLADERGEVIAELRARVAELERKAEAWKDTAEQMNRNAEFYHGIVRQIGEPFGIAARTSDDGSVQDDVLALRVPELVEALRKDAEQLKRDRTALRWTLKVITQWTLPKDVRVQVSNALAAIPEQFDGSMQERGR